MSFKLIFNIIKPPAMRLLTLFIALFSASFANAQNIIRIGSPNGAQQLQLTLDAAGNVRYALKYKGHAVIQPSKLGFTLSKPAVKLSQFSVVSIDSTTADETWQPVWGEVDKIRNNYKQLTVGLKQIGKESILLNLVFRVFDDGIGFRYQFPAQAGLQHFILADEVTEFAMAGNHKTFWIPGDYDSNEWLYNTTKLTEVDALAAEAREKDIAVTAPIGRNAVQTPLMMKSANGLYINLHEAALVNYPAMNLVLNKSTLTFTSHLVPDAVGNKAYLQTPFNTPWRTILLSDKAVDILSSKTILNLNEPSTIANTDWIKPQKYVGMWWEMHIGKATWQREGGKHGANTANVKTYIDFAAANGFDGVLVEGWNDGWEDWFGNWKENVFDFVTPYPDYNIDELTAYAKSKGVRIIMHHETSGSVTNYERWMDTAFRFMRAHNMNTVKTGYVGRIIPRGEHHDVQWMVNHYNRVAQKAAAKQIMVVAHEPVRPTGLHRTYPNWLASEAARGSEFNNAPQLGITPEHNTILPFTRLMGGPMDYTPGLFHMQLNQFDSSRKQRVRSTLCKQLALYITMYSPVQMAADLPENYGHHMDAFQFIKDVAVDWSDTKILEAEPGDYITIARKAKQKTGDKERWFVGAITDENARQLSLSLSFLIPGKKYEAVIYRDGDKASWSNNPEDYRIEKQMVDNNGRLTVRLAPGGGCAISLVEW